MEAEYLDRGVVVLGEGVATIATRGRDDGDEVVMPDEMEDSMELVMVILCGE